MPEKEKRKPISKSLTFKKKKKKERKFEILACCLCLVVGLSKPEKKIRNI